MNFKTVLALMIVIASVTAGPVQSTAGIQWPAPGAVNPWMPPWLASAPWYPQWSPCTEIGSTCLDCTTKLVCTKVGGLERACTDPTLPYCNLGRCSATPTAQCTPAPVTEDQTE